MTLATVAHVMKTRILTFAFFLFTLTIVGWSKPVDQETALQLANKFISTQSAQQLNTRSNNTVGKKQGDRINLRKVELTRVQTDKENNPPFHIFTNEPSGFVIIAGDDLASPILGYSLKGNFDPDTIPPSLEAWLKIYATQITHAVNSGNSQDAVIAAQWQALSDDGFSGIQTQGISALISSLWDQRPYYNDLCPYDSGQQETTLTGCVATAMAQIMNYWQYPNTGKGVSRYQHSDYGLQSAEYGSTTYDWAGMPSRLTQSSSSSQVAAIATLMYHCGVSVQMDYGIDASGISDITKVVDSLRSYFDYASTVSLIKRTETTDSIWFAGLKNELDAQRPIFYVGFDPDGKGGHAWVCDGYDDSDRFHMNWGWDGNANGYYPLSAIRPAEGYDYTDYQMAILGITPLESSGSASSLELYSAITISPDPINIGESLTVGLNVLNTSANSFAGWIAAVVFNDTNKFLISVGEKYEDDLPAGYRYNSPLSLSSSGTGDLKPGDYYVSVIYKKDGTDQWIKASSGNFSNWKKFTVSSADSDLSLYAELSIGQNSIIKQNTPFDLSFNITNSGNNNFTGVVEVDFYELNGSHLSDIGSIYHYDINDLAPNYHYTGNHSKTVTGVNIAPGEYLAAVTHKKAGSSWELTGNGSFNNPVRVWVQVGPDAYEPNDDEFTYLTATFVNNVARILTVNASIHSEEDTDLFFVNLPAGYDYMIDGRVHDSWSSDNGKTYTTDVLWVLLTSDDFANLYDDIMDVPYRLNNGGYLAIGIGGWGVNLGTYDFEMNITRMAKGSPLDPNNPRTYATPLYRFHRSDNDSHFFTANIAERDNIIATQPATVWTYEGISQRVLHSQIPHSNPVYRLHNHRAGSHFYTASQAELNSVLQNMGDTFNLEGIAFYVLSTPAYGAKPVYRFYSPQTASHFFTISEAEKNQIIATIPTSKLRYEGVAWYAYP